MYQRYGNVTLTYLVHDLHGFFSTTGLRLTIVKEDVYFLYQRYNNVTLTWYTIYTDDFFLPQASLRLTIVSAQSTKFYMRGDYFG